MSMLAFLANPSRYLPIPSLPFTGVFTLEIRSVSNIEEAKTPLKNLYIRVDIENKTHFVTKTVDSVDQMLCWDENVELKLFKVSDVRLILFRKRRIADDVFVADITLSMRDFLREMRSNEEQTWNKIEKLEPIGTLLFSLYLSKDTRAEYQSFQMCSKLFDNIHGGRVMMQIVDMYGHKFKEVSIVQITFCSVCRASISKKGYRCQVCNLTVHRQCHTRIEKTCIGSLGEDGPNELFHDVMIQCQEHQFEPHTYFRPTFCSHCGCMLYGFFKQGLKCKILSCDINVHFRCEKICAKNCAFFN